MLVWLLLRSESAFFWVGDTSTVMSVVMVALGLCRALLERVELSPCVFQLSLLQASEFRDFPAVVCEVVACLRDEERA